MAESSKYTDGFEENDGLRSAFIRDLTLQQIRKSSLRASHTEANDNSIPRILVRYWHDPHNMPCDVQECIDSWNPMKNEGFDLRTFDDTTAATYIADRYGKTELAAFERCHHPAMRSDYLRMCAILAEGGMYVDADDVLTSDGWKQLLLNGKLKLQPLCYDIPTGAMIPADQIWRHDLSTVGRIFYVNNNPLIAPPGHSLLRRALSRASERLLRNDATPEIQSTTGPGNLSACLAAHARSLEEAGNERDFQLIENWSAVAETRWNLSYRNDARNWRNVNAN